MADYIFFAMPTTTPENTTSTDTNPIRRAFGTSSLFGRRSSKSKTEEETSPSISTTPIRIVPSIENPSRSLVFNIIERDLEVGRIIKIGRFTDKSSIKNHISFKSKVVSRAHCEIWLNHDGKVLIKDTKSSSGTFVNHIRLSPANTESRPFEIKDGDIVQLGIDYQGGYEEIYRSVKMKFEINRKQQQQQSSFSMSAFNHLRQLTSCHNNNFEVEECCICLYALAPFQALFVAPCSHSYHFKCIKPLLDSYPGFQCPICRTYSDLDASVAIETEEVIEKYGLQQTNTLSLLSSSPSSDISISDQQEEVFSTTDKRTQLLVDSSSSSNTILSRQSTANHYNSLNNILEESIIPNNACTFL